MLGAYGASEEGSGETQSVRGAQRPHGRLAPSHSAVPYPQGLLPENRMERDIPSVVLGSMGWGCDRISVLTFFFSSHTSDMWKFLGWGLNLHHSSNQSQCNDNAGFLTHSATTELPVLTLIHEETAQDWEGTKPNSFFFLLFRTASASYGGSQAGGPISHTTATATYPPLPLFC